MPICWSGSTHWVALTALALIGCNVDVANVDGNGGQSASAGVSGGGSPGAGTGGVVSGTGGTPTPVGGASTAGAAGMPSNGGSPSGGSPSAGAGGLAGASSGGGATSSGGAAGAGGSIGNSASGLPVPPGAADVPKPSGAVGGLTVLDWAGFKAAVSYTFDDSNSSQIAHYDELAALGVRFTFYLQTGKNESNNEVWAKAVKAGHELGNHTKSHSSNATGEDIDAATQFIESKFGVKVWTMAAPNGAAGYTDLAKSRFLINRGVANGLVGPNDNSDPFTLFCFIPAQGALQSAFDSQVTSARSAGKWRIVLVHGFTGGTDSAYQPVALDQFTASVKAAKALNDVWLDSVVNVGSYWRGQKAFTQTTPMTSGDQQTWTWKLPDHFPPGKFLRVKVTGGTPSQKGTPLTWDPHGYYEIALDAGSLTLGP